MQTRRCSHTAHQGRQATIHPPFSQDLHPRYKRCGLAPCWHACLSILQVHGAMQGRCGLMSMLYLLVAFSVLCCPCFDVLFCLSAFPQTQQGAPPQPAQAQNGQPQNAAMLAAYQAALNSFVNNRQPRQAGPQGQQQTPNAAQGGPQPGVTEQPQPAQGQQPNQSTAPAQAQAPMYAMHAMHAPAMLAYLPVLVSCQRMDLVSSRLSSSALMQHSIHSAFEPRLRCLLCAAATASG